MSTKTNKPEKDLAILVKHENEVVRAAIARVGRPQDLIILIHDSSDYVRHTTENCSR